MSGNQGNFIGTVGDDSIAEGAVDAQGKTLQEKLDQVDKANGNVGNDTISTGAGNDLAAGDMVGNEWTLVDGKWVYDASLVVDNGYGQNASYDDSIVTGDGDDVLLGNGGDDILRAGEGNDLLNAGRDNDTAFGDAGDDTINLGMGDDYAEGGTGNDTINAGSGNDVVYGDVRGENVLSGNTDGLNSFEQMSQNAGWTFSDDVDGTSQISKSTETIAGSEYTIGFELAANLSGGYSSGKVEVLWNGEVVDTVEVTSGVYEKFEVTVESTGEQGNLSFRAVEGEGTSIYNFDGPIISYEKEISLGGQNVQVDAFAPGQAQLYQVIDGQLKAFDTETNTYVNAGDPPGFKINGVGFNVEDDLIYGVAKSSGVDALGNPVNSSDIVMIDATGAAYRVGDGFYGDYVGDFDDSGNLWTFHSALNRLSVVDVDSRDADGNPEIQHINLPDNLFEDRTYDLAYNSEDGSFYAVVSPSKNGQDGKVVKIDVSSVRDGGMPEFQEVPITGTLYGDTMESGMAKGAYGAVFMDGDGNLYYGLNRGDHDLDSATAAQGSIFKVNVDWDAGQAYSEFMAESQSTSSNDGAVDPRSSDAFAEVDANAAVLIRNPELVETGDGNDNLRGGAGDDTMYGNAGDDKLFGGAGEDHLSGDEGADNMAGGDGRDVMFGGEGDDRMRGQGNNDTMSGGEGNDYMSGGAGWDVIDGGAGKDKIVGGLGADTISGGAGNDHMWGGDWKKDGFADTFVVSGGSGQDMIHDFEADTDNIDLSAYGLEFSDVQAVISDKGWATEIDLSQLAGGQSGDRLFLKAVKADDLDESNFIL